MQLVAMGFLAALLTIAAGSSHSAGAVEVQVHGVAPCSAGPAPYPWRGLCATYNSNNTYYGVHGLGFPSPLGWGLCAQRPAAGGGYPAPGYRYALAGAPVGAVQIQSKALGWALSEAQRRGWWQWGDPGHFSANQLGVAAKLLYDHVVWSVGLPVLDAATQQALTALQGLLTTATGMTGPPVASFSLEGGGTTLHTNGILRFSLVAPGSNHGLAGYVVTLHLTGATFNSNSSASILLVTNSLGLIDAPFTTNAIIPSSVTARANTVIAQPGLLFYAPTAIILNAQTIASPRAPVATQKSLLLTALGLPTGTVQIQKIGDDPVYVPVTGGVFEILDTANIVVDTLVTDVNGSSSVSQLLPVGNYHVHESLAPIGYALAPDMSIVITENATTLVTIGPAEGDRVFRAAFSLHKRDAPTGTSLAGASYSLTYDPSNTHSANGDTINCVTDVGGQCDWTNLLPGNYLLREISPPPYYVANGTDVWIYVGPGEHLEVTYDNEPIYIFLTARKFNSANYVAIPNATYDLYVNEPGPPGVAPTPPIDSELFAGLTFRERGVSSGTGLLTFVVRSGYTWCLHEVSVPKGFVIDPALHCTGQLVHSNTTAISLAEVTSPVRLQIHKFNSLDPNSGIPGAFYALFVRGTFPTGFVKAPPPKNFDVPFDLSLWAIASTDQLGQLTFTVPSGYSWCAREETAPVGYVLDLALHCTTVLTTSSPSTELAIAVPETLALTGSSPTLLCLGALLSGLGLVLMYVGRRPHRTVAPNTTS